MLFFRMRLARALKVAVNSAMILKFRMGRREKLPFPGKSSYELDDIPSFLFGDEFTDPDRHAGPGAAVF